MSTMDEEEEVEVIFEAWLFKLRDLTAKRTLRLSSRWRKRYFILLRQQNTASLCYYDNKPRSLEEKPRGHVLLQPTFRVDKCGKCYGKTNVCQISTDTEQLVVSSEDEKIYHLFPFFIQTQCQLREELEEECFVVRPDNAVDQQKVGARGSICLLHVSKWGLILSIQLSKCVLAVWPLRCIKYYESSGRGQFAFETGRRAPSGEGKFVFNMRHGQDNLVYDQLDQFVMEAAGLTQLVSARDSHPQDLETFDIQYSSLQSFLVARSESRFLSHLKKISRGIYDQLAEHLGASTATRLNVSSPDLLDKTSPLNRSLTNISGSASGFRPDNSPTRPVDTGARPKDLDYRPQMSNGSAASTSSVHNNSIDSQYLHMSSPPRNNASQIQASYMNTQGTPPPSFYEATEPGRYFDKKVSLIEPDELSADDESLVSSPQSDKAGYSVMQSLGRLRLKSRSCDDLRDYVGPSIEMNSYENETFKISDEMNMSGAGIYSYSNLRDETKMFAYSSPAYVSKQWSPTASTSQKADSTSSAAHLIRNKSPHLMKQLVQGKGLRKSISNPSLLEQAISVLHQPSSVKSTKLPPPPLPGYSTGLPRSFQGASIPDNTQALASSYKTSGYSSYRKQASTSSGVSVGSGGSRNSQETGVMTGSQDAQPKTHVSSPISIQGVNLTPRTKSYKRSVGPNIAQSPTTDHSARIVNGAGDAQDGAKWKLPVKTGVAETLC